jgi:hypothetical protein
MRKTYYFSVPDALSYRLTCIGWSTSRVSGTLRQVEGLEFV